MPATPLTLLQGQLVRVQSWIFHIRGRKISPPPRELAETLSRLPPWQSLSVEALERELLARMLPQRGNQPFTMEWVLLQLDQGAAFGQLPHVPLLRPGDQVRLVLEERAPLRQALALLRERDRWLWLGGGLGYTRQQVQRTMRVITAVLIPVILLMFYQFRDTFHQLDIFSVALAAMMVWTVVGGRQILRGMRRASDDNSERTRQVLSRLGIAAHDELTLSPHTVRHTTESGRERTCHGVYDLNRALQAQREQSLQD